MTNQKKISHLSGKSHTHFVLFLLDCSKTIKFFLLFSLSSSLSPLYSGLAQKKVLAFHKYYNLSFIRNSYTYIVLQEISPTTKKIWHIPSYHFSIGCFSYSRLKKQYIIHIPTSLLFFTKYHTPFFIKDCFNTITYQV